MAELLRLVPVLQKYGDTTFSIVIAWSVTTLGNYGTHWSPLKHVTLKRAPFLVQSVVEIFTTLSLLLGIYRHRRAAQGFKNLYDALGRGMVYLVEAM